MNLEEVRWEIVPYTRGVGIEIDEIPGQMFPHFMKVGLNIEEKTLEKLHQLDFAVLIDTAEEVVAQCWKVLRSGGYLCWVGEKLEKEGLVLFRVLDDDRVLQVFQKGAKVQLTPPAEKTCAIVRYGAWGDALQATSILPGLKAQGYHITFFCGVRAEEILKTDPHIDKLVVTDHNQVPNAWLGKYWKYLASRFDKFINLSESVEGTWLALPGRPSFYWPHELRSKLLNYNYFQFHHDLAGLPYDKPAIQFHPTLEERNWAHTHRERFKGQPLIMWTLAGSSIHKVWPHMDAVLSRILLTWPQARVILVGDEACKHSIEAPWRDEARIIRRSGEWSIRETLAMAELCDVVVGPETGVLNAVSMKPMPKVCILSHSSVENLTRDWVNTYSVFSTQTKCYPCHKMIYGFDHCVRDEETGTAQCQADIPADAVWEALLHSQRKAA